jgi:hypothetical protein
MRRCPRSSADRGIEAARQINVIARERLSANASARTGLIGLALARLPPSL